MENLPIFPEEASTMAERIDLLLVVLIGLATFFLVLVCALVVFFAIRYRSGANVNRKVKSPDNYRLEVVWTIVPTIIVLGLFFWSARIFFEYFRIPEGAQEIYVTGKQWMWKIQHPNGRREINELHAPVHTPITLTMTSEDVIHSFYIPAFRLKKDVLPGRYTSMWFEATKTGVFDLFCAEYCGTNHSIMGGKIVIMQPAEYQSWLKEGNVDATAPATPGERLFTRLGCAVCHRDGPGARGPVLEGLFGSEVTLQDGGKVTADEDYIRESILNPRAKLVAGAAPLMPTYKSQLSQDDVFELVSYIKSLKAKGQAKATP